MRPRTTFYYLWLILLGLCLMPPLQAADCDPQDYASESYRLMLEEFASTQCFSVDKNTTALGHQVRTILKNSRFDDRVRALNALSVIEDALDLDFALPGHPQLDNARLIGEGIAALKQDIAENPLKPRDGLKLDWQVTGVEVMPDALPGVNFDEALTADACTPVSAKNCTDEFSAVAGLLRALYLVNAAIDRYTTNYRAEALQDRVIRRASWDSYYDDLTFQYPWELLFNSWLLESSDNRAVVDGNRLGFRSLPDDKWVLLHPEAVLVYADNANDEYELSVTVEALGYEAFDFDSRGKVGDSWGVSLMAAYMDRVDRPESGWSAGLMFKYQGYSLGVTDNHGDTGIVFNVNLAQRLFDVKQESRRYYDEYQQRITRLGVLIDEGEQQLEQMKPLFLISE